MANLRIANRYAKAFMTAAEELDVLKQVNNDFLVLRRVIQDSREFQLFLKSPVIKKEKKHAVFTATFESFFQPLTMRFFSLLIEKEREDVLPHVIEAFFKLQDEVLGIVHARVKTATELSPQQTEELKQRFEVFSKKKVIIEQSIDKQLIGGFVARIGDTVFDGSVKQQLEFLRKRFTDEIIVP